MQLQKIIEKYNILIKNYIWNIVYIPKNQKILKKISI